MDRTALALALVTPIPLAAVSAFVWTHLEKWFPPKN